MTDARADYWRECIESALDEAEIRASPEQIMLVAEAVQGAHETYDMAFYSPPSREPREIKRLEEELKKERSKVVCSTCSGSGRLKYNAGPWGVNTGCHMCRGEGKVLP
jgi:hypothetical protein